MKKYLLAGLALSAALTAAAQYQVVVTTTEGEQKTFSTSDVNSIRFAPAPNYIKANTFLGGMYNIREGKGIYTFTIGTGTPDNGGDPAEVGDLQLQLAIVAPLSEEAHNAAIPDGFYRGDATKSLGSIDLEGSAMWLRTESGNDGVTAVYFIDATADVTRTDEKYNVKITLDGINGEQVAVSYSGEMKFTPGSSAATDFTTNQDVDFTGGQGRYYGNWYYHFADDGLLQFYTGKFEEGSQTEGYWLQLEYNMPKDESHDASWTPRMIDGVYTVDRREKVAQYTFRPYTLNKGRMIDFWGTMSLTGSYLTYKSATGEIQSALIVGGTMTVTNNGKNYEFDFLAENGIKITGRYDGNVYIVNKCDNSSKIDEYENLPGDVALDFPSFAVALDYYMGHVFDTELFSHILMITDPGMETGDYISLDLFCDSDKLKDGVYTIDDSFTASSGLRGRVDYGQQVLYSWYGDLDSTDDDGVQEFLAPIWGGTVTISTLSNGNRKFDIDLTSKEGKKITGTYSGKLEYAAEEPAQKRKTLKSMRLVNPTVIALKKQRLANKAK